MKVWGVGLPRDLGDVHQLNPDGARSTQHASQEEKRTTEIFEMHHEEPPPLL